MGFYEYWHEREARRHAEEQACVKRAHEWIGRRVRVRSFEVPNHWEYGEVESVDERGMVRILVGYTPDDHPWYVTVSANVLGDKVVRVYGKPEGGRLWDFMRSGMSSMLSRLRSGFRR
jgi:hypothetical protein